MVLTVERDMEAAAVAADRVVRAHQRLVEYLRAGQTLADVDRFVAVTLRDLDCRSAFLRYRTRGYPPFPSHSCLSPNDCVVHGTHLMSDAPLAPGDLLSVDIGVTHRGWIGDAAWTYAIEHASDQAKGLMQVGRESLRRGVEALRPGRPLIDWARVVQTYVEGEQGLHLVRNLGGHGYGRKLHGPPFISNVVPAHGGEWPDAWRPNEPGLLIAVEPMIAIGTGDTRAEARSWPIFTTDGSLSVHYEADVLVTPDGPQNLTEAMFDLPDIVGV